MKKPGIKILKESIRRNFGVLVNISDELNCSRQQLKTWIDSDTELTEEYLQSKESLKDKAEHQLLKNILEGKETSLLFYLKTHAKDRGYSQDPELAAMTFNQLNISVRSEETKVLLDEVIKKISNE